jgi:hypothetical protein
MWALTPTGRRIPLDVEATAEGNVTVDEEGVAWVLNGPQLDEAQRIGPEVVPLFLTHFVTCPDADSWRRKGTPK